MKNDWKYYNPKFEYEELLDPLGASWPWAGHTCFCYELVSNLRPQRVVELGTHYGRSFFTFCQSVKDLDLETELYAVDTWQGDEHAGFYDESVFEKVDETKDVYYSDLNINLLRKTFDTALNDSTDCSVNLFHIDGLHTYEAVKHDFDSWFGRVKANGIILLHDISVTETDFGVFNLWDEIKEKDQTVEFCHSYGLGILFRNPDRFSELAGFERSWQRYYATLSEKKLRQAIQQKDQEINNLNQEITNLKNGMRYLIDFRNRVLGMFAYKVYRLARKMIGGSILNKGV